MEANLSWSAEENIKLILSLKSNKEYEWKGKRLFFFLHQEFREARGEQNAKKRRKWATRVKKKEHCMVTEMLMTCRYVDGTT